MLMSAALTMLGAALGMLGMGASRKAIMSCWLYAGKPCSTPATFAAARVACKGVSTPSSSRWCEEAVQRRDTRELAAIQQLEVTLLHSEWQCSDDCSSTHIFLLPQPEAGRASTDEAYDMDATARLSICTANSTSLFYHNTITLCTIVLDHRQQTLRFHKHRTAQAISTDPPPHHAAACPHGC